MLSGQIDMEAGALRHWSESSPQPGAASAGEASKASWPAAGEGRTVADQSRPEPDGSAAHSDTTGRKDEPRPAQQPEAITARDPRQTSYPWQKSARPETTN